MISGLAPIDKFSEIIYHENPKELRGVIL